MVKEDRFKVELGKQARTQMVFHAEVTPSELIWDDNVWVSFTPRQLSRLVTVARKKAESCNLFDEQTRWHNIHDLLNAAQDAWEVESQDRKDSK